DVVNIFQSENHENSLSLVAENVSYKFRNGNIGLRNINIAESSGKLVGLMGASGSGKSTLLNVLNGNETPSSGSVKINGIDIHKNKDLIEGVVGYVPQDDLLMEDLTVFQNLYYAAKLCFKDLAEEEHQKLVDKTLEALGLSDTKGLKVGSPLEKTISGGQRKRLNIGLELLREPSVLFIDEPTSGLSSRDSENIMDLLRDLSLKGKMIFVVIHQPSIDIFKMFDKLVILDVGGYEIYYGNPIDGIRYFKNVVNLVDSTANINPEQIFNIVEAKVVNEYGYFTKERKITPEQWHEKFNENIEIPSVKISEENPPKSLNIPGKLKQALIFTKRDLLSKLSNKQYLIINLLEAPLLAFLLAFIVRYTRADRAEYNFQENENLPVFFFMSIIVALFMGLTVSAEEIVKDRKILKREAFLNLSRFSYILSKLVILFSISAIQTITFVIIGSLILEIPDMTFIYWLVLFSTSCFANTLGLNISSAFKNVITIYILIPLLIIPQLLLSGVVVNFDKLNPAITSEDKVPFIGEIMASRWAFEALAVAQYKENSYNKQFFEYDQTSSNSEFKTVYLIPSLLTKLENSRLHKNTTDPDSLSQVNSDLLTIKNEIEKMVNDPENITSLQKMTAASFDEEAYQDIKGKLQGIKTYYNKQSKKALAARDKIVNNMRKEYGNDYILEQRSKYINDRIAVIVKNSQTTHRLLEKDNEMIQKLYPIYLMPEYSSNPLDFRAQFYQPYKFFFGNFVPTQWFNIGVIWLMSFLLIITLYFNLLKKLVSGKRQY
ncbi:MAG: ATP-binding cassette domain-containing protein, partial [Cyclobacteriaceae bacterium]